MTRSEAICQGLSISSTPNRFLKLQPTEHFMTTREVSDAIGHDMRYVRKNARSIGGVKRDNGKWTFHPEKVSNWIVNTAERTWSDREIYLAKSGIIPHGRTRKAVYHRLRRLRCQQ